MQFFVTSGCSFLSTPKGYVGIWYVDDGKGNCVAWGSSQSQVVGGAQSALTISTIAGFAAGVMVLFEWLICEVCCAGCLEGLAFCTSWLIGGAVFMIYGMFDEEVSYHTNMRTRFGIRSDGDRDSVISFQVSRRAAIFRVQ